MAKAVTKKYPVLVCSKCEKSCVLAFQGANEGYAKALRKCPASGEAVWQATELTAEQIGQVITGGFKV